MPKNLRAAPRPVTFPVRTPQKHSGRSAAPRPNGLFLDFSLRSLITFPRPHHAFRNTIRVRTINSVTNQLMVPPLQPTHSLTAHSYGVYLTLFLHRVGFGAVCLVPTPLTLPLGFFVAFPLFFREALFGGWTEAVDVPPTLRM